MPQPTSSTRLPALSPPWARARRSSSSPVATKSLSPAKPRSRRGGTSRSPRPRARSPRSSARRRREVTARASTAASMARLVGPGPAAQAPQDEGLERHVAREPRQLAQLAQRVARAAGIVVAHELRQRSRPTRVAPAAPEDRRRQQREGDADRRPRVVHEHPPAGPDAVAPAHEVGARGAEAVRAVHEEDVDRSGDLLQRDVGEGAHLAHAPGDPGAREVGVERLVVGRAAIGVGGDLLGPAVRAGVRIDAHDLDLGAGQHDGRAPAEGADLHDAAARSHPRRGGEEAPRLRLGQPALDVAGVRPRVVEAAHDAAAARRRRRRAVSPRARIDDAATHCTPKTIVAKSTMPAWPAVSRKGSAMATTPSTHRKRVSPSATMYWTVREGTASSVMAAPRSSSASAASVKPGPKARRSSSSGATAKMSSAGAA